MTRRLYRAILAALAVYWLTIFVLTHIPMPPPPAFHVDDKVGHVTAYFLLAVLLNLAIGQKLSTHRDWVTLLIVLVYGAFDEWLQLFVGRTCDLIDWYADAAGAALGIIACGLLRGAYGTFFGRRAAAPAEEPLECTRE